MLPCLLRVSLPHGSFHFFFDINNRDRVSYIYRSLPLRRLRDPRQGRRWRATPVRPRGRPQRHQYRCPSQFLEVSTRTLNFFSNQVQQRTNPDPIPVPDPVPVPDLVPVLVPDPLLVPDLSPFPNCHFILISVIVMAFWYSIWNGLSFFELFKLLFFIWDWSRPPCFLWSYDLCLFPSSYVSFFTQLYGQEKS